MRNKVKKDAIMCFAVDSETKEVIEEYLYRVGKWESFSEFIRWLLKQYLKKALAEYS